MVRASGGSNTPHWINPGATAKALSYSQVPNKRGVLINREVGKIPKFNKRGGRNLSNDFK